MIQILALALFLVPPAHKSLTWDDFRGHAPISSPWAAVTQTSMELTTTETDGLYSFSVGLKFDGDESWTKTDNPKQLAHENLHWDIAFLIQQRIVKALSPYQNTRKVKEATRLYDKLVARWNWMERQYDMESDHSRDISGQKKWEAKIKRELAISCSAGDRE